MKRYVATYRAVGDGKSVGLLQGDFYDDRLKIFLLAVNDGMAKILAMAQIDKFKKDYREIVADGSERENKGGLELDITLISLYERRDVDILDL